MVGNPDMAEAAVMAQSGHRPWWESRPVLVGVVLLAAVPLLYPEIPPLVDLFGHMGRSGGAAKPAEAMGEG